MNTPGRGGGHTEILLPKFSTYTDDTKKNTAGEVTRNPGNSGEEPVLEGNEPLPLECLWTQVLILKVLRFWTRSARGKDDVVGYMITFLKLKKLIMREGDSISLALRRGRRGGSDRRWCRPDHKEPFLTAAGLRRWIREGFHSWESQSHEPLSVVR